MSSNKTFGEKLHDILPPPGYEWDADERCKAERAIIDLIESDLVVASSFSDDILAEQRSILRGEKG